ncbi:nucleotidyl transferase AbiEii/AbiGii toxin family protein [Flavobacterium columnare]|uniref:nucleotidyl transferase AbiEii/AbiGii toxin family protein n=1 Tax=Flavobacterium columnare TaxID=996 RepID=UPI004033C6D7
MSAVSAELIQIIKELQCLPSLADFSLAGGTNLALRYNHRISIDIDLIAPKIIGKIGYEDIICEVKSHFGENNTIIQLINEEFGDQFLFLRVFITKDDLTVKVEFLQNMITLIETEIHDAIRVVSRLDIGLFKLMSASNRLAKKDIYDLAYITEEISIIELYNNLKDKKERYCEPIHRTIFDLDDEVSPVDTPELLLEFDSVASNSNSRPFHSHDRIDLVKGSKSWNLARTEWRSKVRQLFNHLRKDFPGPKGIDIR